MSVKRTHFFSHHYGVTDTIAGHLVASKTLTETTGLHETLTFGPVGNVHTSENVLGFKQPVTFYTFGFQDHCINYHHDLWVEQVCAGAVLPTTLSTRGGLSSHGTWRWAAAGPWIRCRWMVWTGPNFRNVDETSPWSFWTGQRVHSSVTVTYKIARGN